MLFSVFLFFITARVIAPKKVKKVEAAKMEKVISFKFVSAIG